MKIWHTGTGSRMQYDGLCEVFTNRWRIDIDRRARRHVSRSVGMRCYIHMPSGPYSRMRFTNSTTEKLLTVCLMALLCSCLSSRDVSFQKTHSLSCCDLVQAIASLSTLRSPHYIAYRAMILCISITHDRACTSRKAIFVRSVSVLKCWRSNQLAGFHRSRSSLLARCFKLHIFRESSVSPPVLPPGSYRDRSDTPRPLPSTLGKCSRAGPLPSILSTSKPPSSTLQLDRYSESIRPTILF